MRSLTVFFCGPEIGGIGFAQIAQPNPVRTLEIKLPKGVPSESVFIRYVLAGEDFGGLVEPCPKVSSYLISTARAGVAASRIRSLVYAPGCAIQVLIFPFRVRAMNSTRSFASLRPLRITGAITRTDPLYGQK